MAIKSVIKHGWWLENPDLGAPSGQELYDYPIFVGDGLHFIVIKLLGVLFSDPTLVLNLYFLLSFPLVALASFLVLRQLGISGGTALVCSVIFALAPYHFVRGERHLNLAVYYSVPVGAYLVLSILSGKPLFTRRTLSRPRLLAWASKRSLVTLALCLLVASSAGSNYYAVFTCMLLVGATVLILVTRREVRTLVQGSTLVGLILGFLALNSLPNLMYSFANGPNNYVANRGWAESEKYSLNLIKMVLPTPGHQIDALSNLVSDYYEKTMLPNEGLSQSLGFIATFGLAWLLIVVLAGCLSPRWEIDLRHRQMATATLIAFLIGTTGGISTLFAYLISTEIRSWNRISIFIAFFAIAAIALLLDALQERIHVRRGRRVLVGTLLLSVLLIGLYDQSNDTFVPDYSTAKDEYSSDAAFVRAIDDEMPPQAQVFQLPYTPFPEAAPLKYEMRDYELLRPYFHESDLRWSYGTVKGRPTAKWQEDLAGEAPKKLLSEVSAAGFDGIYIDRFGYADRAAELERRLGKQLEVEPLVSSNGRMSFFSLLPYKEDLQGHTSVKSSQR